MKYKKRKAKKKIFIFLIAEAIAGIFGYFIKKNKKKIVDFAEVEKDEIQKFIHRKENSKKFYERTKKHIYDFFIPHEGNSHKPKSLRPKALAMYLAIAIVIKGLATGILFFTYPNEASLARIVSQEMIDLTNQERMKNGLLSLRIDPILSQAAEKKGEDMIKRGYFSHNTPEGKKPWEWIDTENYDYVFAGENLAMDFTSGKMIEEAFMKSPAHKRNILNSDYQDIGIAVVSGKMLGRDTDILVEFFGATKSEALAAKKNMQANAYAKNNKNAASVPAQKTKNANLGLQNSEGIIVLSAERTTKDDIIDFTIQWMNILFIAFIIFIVMCLSLNVFIKIRVQHNSVILQSLVVLALISALFIVKLHFVEKIAHQLLIL